MSNYNSSEDKVTTSKLDFNFMTFLAFYTKNMRTCLNYAYPDNTFVKSSGHTSIQMSQSLSRAMSRVCEGLKDEVENNPALDLNQKTNFKNMLTYTDKVSERIRTILEKSYPDNYYNGDSAHLYISQVFAVVTLLEDYHAIYKDSTPLMKINMTNVIRGPFNYSSIIKRAYPNDQYSDTTGHEALQRLRQVTFFIKAFVTNIRTNNEPAENDFDLKSRKLPEKTSSYLKDLETQLVELADTSLIAYPTGNFNTNLGHTAFTEAIRKINQITKLIAANTEHSDLAQIVKDRDEKANPLPKAPEDFKENVEINKDKLNTKKEEVGIKFKF